MTARTRRHLPEITRKRISRALKGRPLSRKHRRAISEGMKKSYDERPLFRRRTA